MGNIAGSYNAGTGVMTLTSAGDTATRRAVAGGASRGAVLEQLRQSVDGGAHGELHRERRRAGLEHGRQHGQRGGGERRVGARHGQRRSTTRKTVRRARSIRRSRWPTWTTRRFRPATVSITGNFASGQDVLSFTNVPATMGNIAGVVQRGHGGDDADLGRRHGDPRAVAGGAACGAVLEQLRQPVDVRAHGELRRSTTARRTRTR